MAKRCRCGFELTHPLVAPELHYSPPKWLLLCLGATPYPTSVEYHCTKCHGVVGMTKNPTILHHF